MERLNKYISSSGFTSRRNADELIFNGSVTVNDIKVIEPGYQVKDNDVVKVDGVRIKHDNNYVYYMLNKPTGYISSTKDENMRKTVLDLVPNDPPIKPIGRLDYDTSGLLILTNDGEFINMVANPVNKIEKEYKVKVQGLLRKTETQSILKGVDLGEYKTSPCKITDVKYNDEKTSTTLSITIKEGKNREVRRLFEYINHPVKSLKRVRIGNLNLDIDSGTYRRLKPHEIKLLKLLALGKIQK